jgi:WD40 repeat protein
MACSPNASLVFGHDRNSIMAFSVSVDEIVLKWAFPLPEPIEPAHQMDVISPASNGELVAVANHNSVFLLGSTTGELQSQLRFPKVDGAISSIRLSHHSDWIAIGSTTGSLCLHALRSDEAVAWTRVAGRALTTMRFTPSDDRLIIASADGRISAWNPQTRFLEGVFTSGGGRPAQSLAISRDGRTLASVGSDQDSFVRLWNIPSGLELCGLWTLPGFIVRDVHFSPDGNTLAACSSAYGWADGRIWFWSIQ